MHNADIRINFNVQIVRLVQEYKADAHLETVKMVA